MVSGRREHLGPHAQVRAPPPPRRPCWLTLEPLADVGAVAGSTRTSRLARCARGPALPSAAARPRAAPCRVSRAVGRPWEWNEWLLCPAWERSMVPMPGSAQWFQRPGSTRRTPCRDAPDGRPSPRRAPPRPAPPRPAPRSAGAAHGRAGGGLRQARSSTRGTAKTRPSKISPTPARCTGRRPRPRRDSCPARRGAAAWRGPALCAQRPALLWCDQRPAPRARAPTARRSVKRLVIDAWGSC